jgi:hypothetical protein
MPILSYHITQHPKKVAPFCRFSAKKRPDRAAAFHIHRTFSPHRQFSRPQTLPPRMAANKLKSFF